MADIETSPIAGLGGLDWWQYNAGSEKSYLPDGSYDYDTDFRGYDPQIGRFKGVDALADALPGISTFQFGYNNPLSFQDPTGLFSQSNGGSSGGGGGWGGILGFGLNIAFNAIGSSMMQHTPTQRPVVQGAAINLQSLPGKVQGGGTITTAQTPVFDQLQNSLSLQNYDLVNPVGAGSKAIASGALGLANSMFVYGTGFFDHNAARTLGGHGVNRTEYTDHAINVGMEVFASEIGALWGGMMRGQSLKPKYLKVRTNDELIQAIANKANKNVPGPYHDGAVGIDKHLYAKKLLDRYQKIFGERNLKTEINYLLGEQKNSNIGGSSRFDIYHEESGFVWDYKFYNPYARKPRYPIELGQKARRNAGKSITINPVYPQN